MQSWAKLSLPISDLQSYRSQSFDLRCKSNDWFLYLNKRFANELCGSPVLSSYDLLAS